MAFLIFLSCSKTEPYLFGVFVNDVTDLYGKCSHGDCGSEQEESCVNRNPQSDKHAE
jgi:hypothetical protein